MVTIREAKKKDVYGMGKIDKFANQLNSYSGVDALKLGNESEEDYSYYLDFIISKDKWCYIAEENNEILGFVLFNIKNRESYYQIKKLGYVDLLYITEKARGKGIAKILMAKVEEVFKNSGIKIIELSVHSDNAACQIWRKFGFKDYKINMYKEL